MDRRKFVLKVPCWIGAFSSMSSPLSWLQLAKPHKVAIETTIELPNGFFIGESTKNFFENVYDRKSYLAEVVISAKSGDLIERWVSREPQKMTIISLWNSMESYCRFLERTKASVQQLRNSHRVLLTEKLHPFRMPDTQDKPMYKFRNREIVQTIEKQLRA